MIATSIRSKIQFVFALTIILLGLLFVLSIKYDHAKIEDRNIAQEHAITHYLYNYFLKYKTIDKAYLDAQNVSIITDKWRVIQIERYFKEKGKYTRYAVDTVHFKRIIVINNDRFKLILENKNQARFPIKQIIIFTTIFFLIIGLYLWIMRSLKPISILKNQIKTFSKGDLNIKCKSDKQDEIAEVANEFDNAVSMIRDLIQSRQLFLRAIMHELKTPIGKGRLVSEMLQDEKAKKRLHSIFERLNLLIDEFAKIEKITSKNFDLNPKPYKMSDLVEGSIDILMIENPKKFISTTIINDYIIEVDFELFTLVIKNLLDNGIKYSKDAHIDIIIDQTLTIQNHSNKLNEPLENYFKPFHTSKKGLGLGLYIVKSILDIHKMNLKYVYADNQNSFSIIKQED